MRRMIELFENIVNNNKNLPTKDRSFWMYLKKCTSVRNKNHWIHWLVTELTLTIGYFYVIARLFYIQPPPTCRTRSARLVGIENERNEYKKKKPSLQIPRPV